jgi:hypothetical protein
MDAQHTNAALTTALKLMMGAAVLCVAALPAVIH